MSPEKGPANNLVYLFLLNIWKTSDEVYIWS